MARPEDKESLLALSAENFTKLMAMIENMPVEMKEGSFPFNDRDKNVRDVLGHLHDWHLMFFDWYKDGMAGVKPTMPKSGYTWKTLPALNQQIWESYQMMSLEESQSLLIKSHKRVMELIESHSDYELFTKKYYKWTNTTSLGAYFISATSSHYDWAFKKLSKYQRAMR